MLNTATINIVIRWLNYVLAISFIILGIVGAILIVVIFTKQHLFWRNASITYLLVSAKITGIHLPMIYSQSILVHGFGLGLFNTNDIACREHKYLLYITTVYGIPFGFQGIYLELSSKIKKDAFRLALEDFFGQVILLLFHCNYVCTFYIYVYMASEVHRVFKDLIFKYVRKTRAISADYYLIGETSLVHTHVTQ
jgi:hypothetical protein